MFRFLFIFLPKLVHVGMWLLDLVSYLLYGWEAFDIIFVAIVVLFISVCLLLLYLFAIKKTLPCPRCGNDSPLYFGQDEELGVHCPVCGDVYVMSPLSWKIRVKPKDGGEARLVK